MKRPKLPPVGSVVELQWQDAWSDLGEVGYADLSYEALVTSYGVLIRTAPVVSIAHEVLGPPDAPVEDLRFRRVINVPPSLVVSCKVLR